MKYYGMTFNKFKSTKRMIGNKTFDDVYEALENANLQWETENEDSSNCIRLLVIISFNEESKMTEQAFFQFKNSISCQNFIISREKIVWSLEEKEKWNGNVHVMGKSVTI